MLYNNSLYGNYRTRTFADVYPDIDSFVHQVIFSGLDIGEGEKVETRLKQLYYLLYGMYGNSHIAYSDENQFKYRLYGIIFEYFPTWSKKLDVQDDLRGLTDEQIALGSKQVYNKALNPGGVTPTGIDDEINTINEQTVAKSKRGVLERKSLYSAMLNTDFNQYFLARFRTLFLTVVQPELPLWYETEADDRIIIEGDEENE